MSFFKETAYGTAIAPDTNINKFYEPTEPIILDVTQVRVDNASFIKGHEFPEGVTKEILVSQDIEIPFTFPLSLELMGLLLAFATGADTVSGISPDFTHTFVTSDLCANDQLPSTNWILGLVGETDSFLLVKGLVINDLTISGTEVGFLTISGTAYTDGSLTDKPAFTFPTSSSAVNFLVNTEMDYLTDVIGGTPVTKKSIFRGFEWSLNNNLDREAARSNIAAAGLFLGDLPVGDREVSLSVTVQGYPGDVTWDLFIANTGQEVIVDVTKTAMREIEIQHRETVIDECKASFEGQRDVLSLTYKSFFNTTDSSPFLVTVENGDAAYLT